MDIGTLVVILFILAPLLEKLFTAGKQKQPPPPQQRRPQPRPPEDPAPRTRQPLPRPGRRPAPYEVPQSSGPVRVPQQLPQSTGRAEDMLPDDLWELVTGEKRPSRPVPAPVPDYARHLPESTHSYDEDAVDEEKLATREQQPSRELSIPPRVPAGKYVPVHTPPQVVSLEDNIPTDEQRHTQFHHRISHLEPAARMRVDAVPLAGVLASSQAMRQAFIMMEVLGKPKGLE